MMRRRFGRGRKNVSTKAKSAPIDAARCFETIVNEKVVNAAALDPVAMDEIPDHFAAVAVGERDGGGKLVVAYAPRHGGDAALAGLAYAQSLAGEDGFQGEVVAVCPQWSIAARRRLGILAAPGFEFRAVAASALADGANAVEAPAAEMLMGATPGQLADGLQGAPRDLFLRALAALEGLAAKHSGAVRVVGTAVELVLLAGPVALIRAEGEPSGESRVLLETFFPEKTSEVLDEGDLALALDRLEGSLRKRLNDRRVKSSEEAMRAGLSGQIVTAEGIRNAALWPLAGSTPEVLDLVGVAADGVPVIAASRSKLSLPELGEILDAVATLRPTLPTLLAGADAPLRLASLRLVLAAKEFGSSVSQLLSLLSLEHRSYEIEVRRGHAPTLRLQGSGAAALAVSVPQAKSSEEDRPEGDSPSRSGSNRRRRGRRSRSQRGARERSESTDSGDSVEPNRETESEAASKPRYDEVSLFDLDEASDLGGDAGTRRPRRGRKRGRRGRSRSGESEARGSESESEAEALTGPSSEADEGPPESQSRGRGRRKAASRAPEVVDDSTGEEVDEDLADALVPLVAEIDEPDIDPTLVYDEDATSSLEDVPDTALAEEDVAESPEAEGPLRLPRRRAAIVAHADRESLIAALLLARDLRLLEGLWVYPQSDLMTFFRSVATDLREETPIYVVGFTASPARDILQAVSLYSDRIAWFDHHDWPPEDLESLRETIGGAHTHISAGTESSIPAVLGERMRRSRFSDKVVELASGRFSEHDYERWGRIWWERLAAAAAKPGERRADLEPLLVGRPSDLAREAADLPAPPPPLEVEFVAGRDFRVVHFGGFQMVVVPVPTEFNVHLAGRVARERYGAQLSLSFHEGEEVLILAGEEGPLRRNLDLLAMATHLVSKHDWIDALALDDFVARVRVRDFVANPERLDDVIGEIAMGRSIMEG